MPDLSSTSNETPVRLAGQPRHHATLRLDETALRVHGRTWNLQPIDIAVPYEGISEIETGDFEQDPDATLCIVTAGQRLLLCVEGPALWRLRIEEHMRKAGVGPPSPLRFRDPQQPADLFGRRSRPLPLRPAPRPTASVEPLGEPEAGDETILFQIDLPTGEELRIVLRAPASATPGRTSLVAVRTQAQAGSGQQERPAPRQAYR